MAPRSHATNDIGLSDERLDAIRFALMPQAGPVSWACDAARLMARHPSRTRDIILARLRGKRLRARHLLAALIGLDHRRLWRSRIAAMPSRPDAGGGQDDVAVMSADALRAGTASTAAVVLLVAPGHTLEPEARGRVQAAFAADPGLQGLYGDAIVEAGQGRELPILRPAFDPDYLMAVDYIGPVVAFRRTALKAVGPADAPTSVTAVGLLLDISSRFGPAAIRHLPKVLSRWRIDRAGEGPAGTRAARVDLLRRRGLAAASDGDGVITVLRPLPEPRPLVSLIVPTRDRLDLLAPCIDSLRERTDWPEREILICDNDSREPRTLAYFRDLTERGRARIVACPGPFDFAAMNNAAASEARGRLLAFVNNDVEAFRPDWLERLCREAVRPDVGAVGARLLDGDGRIQHGGIVLGTGGLATHGHRFFPGDALGYLSALEATRQVSAVTAACLVVEATKFATVGGFDAKTFAVDFNDVDLCLRLAQAGYRTLYVGAAVLHHREAASRRWTAQARARHAREVEAFKKRWGPLLVQDPHYHPAFDPDLGTHARLRKTWPEVWPAADMR